MSGFYQVRSFKFRTARMMDETDEVLLPDGWEPVSASVVGAATVIVAKKRHARKGRPAQSARVRRRGR